jgi:molecular chaperone GrpE
MNGIHDTEELLARFRAWLEQTRAEAHAPGGEADVEADVEAGVEAGPVGLLQLVEEFTALRHEIKLQTRSARGVEERAAEATAGLREAIDQFHAIPVKEAEAAQRAAEPLAVALADLDEALRRGQGVIEGAHRRIAEESAEQVARQLEELRRDQSWLARWFCRRWQREVARLFQEHAEVHRQVLDSLAEGYGLIQSRLDRAMARDEIARISCMGRLVDPNRMTVVAMVDDPTAAPGTVVEEIRSGYTWKGRVLRFAEVRAARRRGEPQEEQEEQGD